MQLYDSQPIIYSANESLKAITSVLLFAFLLMVRNNPLLLREQKRYGLLTSKLVGLFVYCVNLCHVCMYVSYVTVLPKKDLCTLSFVLVNGVNLSFNLDHTQQKIPVTQVIRNKIRHYLIETQALHLTVTNYFNFCDNAYCFCICTQNFPLHIAELVDNVRKRKPNLRTKFV